MSGVELPCDWIVNRRPVATAAKVNDDSPPPPPPTSHHPSNNNNNNEEEEEDEDEEATTTIEAEDEQQQQRRKKPKAIIVAQPKKKPAAEPTTKKKADVETEEERSVTAHPLGPYMFDHHHHHHDDGESRETVEPPQPSTDALVSGRIKALVLQQLRLSETTLSETKKSLDSESLLSRLPYRKMLSDMFGGSLRGNLRNLTIPYVTRAYEESFMREPMRSNERECANGKQCECMFIDRAQPFVGVEFLLPGEAVPRTPHLCVLCCRAITQQLYYDVMFDKADFPGTIQRFGNIHSQPGEYALDAMLIATPAAPAHIMPLPIVSHQRNRYMVHISGGIKWLRQSRVYFQSTPSCSADGGR